MVATLARHSPWREAVIQLASLDPALTQRRHSSGTVGAALAAALAGVRSIALSYGHFSSLPPALAAASSAAEPASLAADASSQVQALALDATVRLVERLWTEWEAGVGTYAVNVPLGWTLRSPEIAWTRMWQSQYGQVSDAQVLLLTPRLTMRSSTARSGGPTPLLSQRARRARLICRPQRSITRTCLRRRRHLRSTCTLRP